MVVNQQNLQGLMVAYSTAFNRSLTETRANYPLIATEVPSTTREQSYKWLGQMPQMREWIGERELQKLESYGYSIQNKPFEMSVGVPKADIEDDQYGVYTPLFNNMGECAALHPDDLVYTALMDGFTEKCYDGKMFFASDHKSGTKTFSNKSNEKLSPESYERARASMMSLTGDKGVALKIIPNLLVVSATNEKMGRQILKAELIDGSTNVLKDTAELHVEPTLAAHPDYWFLLCTVRFLKPIIYQKRQEIKFVSLTNETDENVFMRNEYIYGADGRSNAGYGFWQMAFGSTGEVAAQG